MKPRPQIDKSAVIESLWHGLETIQYARYFEQLHPHESFMKDDKEFGEGMKALGHHSEALTRDYNAIVRSIKGIPTNLGPIGCAHLFELLDTSENGLMFAGHTPGYKPTPMLVPSVQFLAESYYQAIARN